MEQIFLKGRGILHWKVNNILIGYFVYDSSGVVEKIKKLLLTRTLTNNDISWWYFYGNI